MQTNNYVLPEWRFVGGETQKRIFTIYKTDGSTVHNLPNASIELAVVDFIHPKANAILPKRFDIQSDDTGSYCNVVVVLDSSDTVNLSGKYIYQISIKDSTRDISISKGIMYISENIDKSFICK